MLSLLSVSSAQEVASTPGTSLATKAKDDEFKLEQFVVTGVQASMTTEGKTSYSITRSRPRKSDAVADGNT